MNNYTTDRKAVLIRLVTLDGVVLEKNYDMGDAPNEDSMNPPKYLFEMKKTWDNPSDPVTYTASVEPNFEHEAFNWLSAL